MAHARAGRKGWRGALRVIGMLVVAALVSFPMSFIATMLMSPLLGRLETRYGIELVGHSGPSDWIFASVFGIATILVFALIWRLGRPTDRASGSRVDQSSGSRPA